MKSHRKLIATLIAMTMLLTCNTNYKIAFATETNIEEVSLESTNATSPTEDESITPVENTTVENNESISENTPSSEEAVEEENPIINEESDIVISPDTSVDDDNNINNTENNDNSEGIVNEDETSITEDLEVISDESEVYSEVDSKEIDEDAKITLNGIKVNGTLLDFNNITKPTITVDVADEFKDTMTVNIQLVNINDTSKTLTYSGRNTNVATLNTSSVPGDGIYEISKIELLKSGYSEFYDLAYINPKYKDIVVTPSHNIEFADFSNGFQLEVKNSAPFSFSFESFSTPSSASNGDDFTPTITIKSNKEISYVSAFYKSDNDSIYVGPSNVTKNGDYYTINLVGMTYSEGYTPTEYLRSGEYSIYSLSLSYTETLSDGTSSNYTLVFANTTTAGIFENDGVYDFSQLNITCDNPNQDITPPTITDACLEKNNAIPGDQINLKIYVSDDNSGFYNSWQEAYYTWTNENGDKISGPSSYDPSISAFVGYASVNEDAKPGVYTLTNATIYDKAYNLVDLSKTDPAILAKLTITIGDPNSGSGDNNGGSGGSDSGNNSGSDSGNNNGSGNNGNNNEKPSVAVKPENKPTTTTTSTTQTSQNSSTSTLPQTGDPSALPILGLLTLSLGAILKGKKKL